MGRSITREMISLSEKYPLQFMKSSKCQKESEDCSAYRAGALGALSADEMMKDSIGQRTVGIPYREFPADSSTKRTPNIFN